MLQNSPQKCLQLEAEKAMMEATTSSVKNFLVAYYQHFLEGVPPEKAWDLYGMWTTRPNIYKVNFMSEMSNYCNKNRPHCKFPALVFKIKVRTEFKLLYDEIPFYEQ